MEVQMTNKEILYVIPLYKEGEGDITKILLEGGIEKYNPFHIRTFIRRLAFDHYMDLKSLKRSLQEQLGQKNILPYPFHSKLILLPLKVRKPLLKKDGAFGYINFIWVKEVLKEGKHCRIIFYDGSELEVLQQYHSVKAKMMQGAWLQDCFIPQNQYPLEKKNEKMLCREELQQIITQLMEMYKEL